MVDRILGGQLEETLRGYAAQGLSPGRMALRLAADYQVEVSGQTIKKWVAALPDQSDDAPAQTPQTARTAQAARTTQTAQAARNVRFARKAHPAQGRDTHVAVVS